MEFITVHTYRRTADLDLYEIDKEILLPIDKIEHIESSDEFNQSSFSEEERKHFKIGTRASLIIHSSNDIKAIFVCESLDTIKEMINSSDESRVLGLE